MASVAYLQWWEAAEEVDGGGESGDSGDGEANKKVERARAKEGREWGAGERWMKYTKTLTEKWTWLLGRGNLENYYTSPILFYFLFSKISFQMIIRFSK